MCLSSDDKGTCDFPSKPASVRGSVNSHLTDNTLKLTANITTLPNRRKITVQQHHNSEQFNPLDYHID